MSEHEEGIGEEGVLPDEPGDPGVFPPAPDVPQPPGWLSDEQLQFFRDGTLANLRGVFPNAADSETEQLADQVLENLRWVSEKWGQDVHCPYCGHSEWEVSFPIRYELAPPVTPPPGITTVLSPWYFPVTCTTCGNTVSVRVPFNRRGLER